jgi:predicted ArsR family transcriptional regulator
MRTRDRIVVVLERGEASTPEIAATLDVGQSAIRSELARMRRVGLVEVLRRDPPEGSHGGRPRTVFRLSARERVRVAYEREKRTWYERELLRVP